MKRSLYLGVSGLLLICVAIIFIRQDRVRRETTIIEANLLPAPSAKSLHPELAELLGKFYEDSLNSSQRVDSLARLAQLYHANGYLNHAWQSYRILIAIDRKNPLWPHRLATVVSGYGQLDDAVSLYRQAIQLNPDYTPTRIHLGDTLLKLNRYDDAKQAFQSVIEADSANPYGLFGLARVALARGDTQGAKRLLESARRSNNRIGGDLLADLYEELGETAKARALLHEITWSSHVPVPAPLVDKIVADCYDSFEVAMAAGKAVRAGDLPKAIGLMKKAIALDPLDPYAHDHLAKLYRDSGDLELARQSYETCTKVLPSYDQGWAGLISIEKETGNHTKASALTDQALVHCPNSSVINNYKGELLLESNRPKEAVDFFQTAVRHKPHHATGYTYLASAYLKLGENQKALEQLQKALKADPSNPLALKLITIFYILAGNEEQAERYKQSATHSPRIEEAVIGQLDEMFRKRFPQ